MRSHKLTRTSHHGVLESEDRKGIVTLDIYSAKAQVKIDGDEVCVTHRRHGKIRSKVLKFSGDFTVAENVGYMLAGRFCHKAGVQFVPRTIN